MGLCCYSLSSLLPPASFLSVEKMGQMGRCKKIFVGMKKKELLSRLHIYIYSQLGECVLLLVFFSLLRQSIQCNCEGGYCYTYGCVSTYSHKWHGLDKPKISFADRTVTWILLFILSGNPEIRDCGPWSMLMTTISARILLWRVNSSRALCLQGALWKTVTGLRFSCYCYRFHDSSKFHICCLNWS